MDSTAPCSRITELAHLDRLVLARSTDGFDRAILGSLDRGGQIGRERKYALVARSVP